MHVPLFTKQYKLVGLSAKGGNALTEAEKINPGLEKVMVTYCWIYEYYD